MHCQLVNCYLTWIINSAHGATASSKADLQDLHHLGRKWDAHNQAQITSRVNITSRYKDCKRTADHSGACWRRQWVAAGLNSPRHASRIEASRTCR